jgi:hypothetical protein
MAKKEDALDAPEMERVGLTGDLAKATSESGEYEDDPDNPYGNTFEFGNVAPPEVKFGKSSLSQQQFQPLKPIDTSGNKAQQRGEIAVRMGISPTRTNLPSGKKFKAGEATYPKFESGEGGAITDVRLKYRNEDGTPRTGQGQTFTAFEPLEEGVAGPVLPKRSIDPLNLKVENVEVFDPSETVQTGNPEFPDSLEMQRAPVENVIQQQATKRASEQKRSYEAKGKRLGTPAAPISVKSKYDLTDEERKGGMPLAKTRFASDAGQEGPAAPVDRDVRDVVRTDGGRGIDPRTGGVVLTQGKTSYGPPIEGEFNTDQFAGTRGSSAKGLQFAAENAPDTTVDSGPLTEQAPASGGRGGQRAIRARMEERAPAIKGVREPVRAELERAEMFGEDVTSRAFDIYSGVGLEPRDPENLKRRGPTYWRAGAGGGDQGGIAIPKTMLPGEGVGTPGVSEAEGEEVEAPKTPEEALSRMGGADILRMAQGAGRSLETAPEGQTAPINVPGVRGKISDIARIRQQASVSRTPVDEQELAALTVLPEATRGSIEAMMRPDLIGQSVSGQVGTSGVTGITEVRKPIKGGDEAARAREARNMAVSLTATQFKKLPEGVAGPVLPMTKPNVDAVIGAERARLAQQAGSFPAQPGEQGREGRARKNVETLVGRTITRGQREADEAANRALGLAGPGGGSVPAPRSTEERRGGGRRQQ